MICIRQVHVHNSAIQSARECHCGTPLCIVYISGSRCHQGNGDSLLREEPEDTVTHGRAALSSSVTRNVSVYFSLRARYSCTRIFRGRNGIVLEHVNNSFVTVEWPCLQLSAMCGKCADVMPRVSCVNRRPCGESQKKDSRIHSAGSGTETANLIYCRQLLFDLPPAEARQRVLHGESAMLVVSAAC